jgi:hypothetical protein
MGIHKKIGSKFFRADHRRYEICAERDRDEEEQDVFHRGWFLKFFAAARVKRESGKKQDRDTDINDVKHGQFKCVRSRAWARQRNCFFGGT